MATISDQAAFDDFITDLEEEARLFPVGNFRNIDLDFCRVWPFLRTSLRTTTLFTSSRVEQVVNAIVTVGDSRCEDEM